MSQLFYKRDDCRLCGSTAVEVVVPLSPMPIATPNFAVPDADKGSPVFRTPVPLDLYLCHDCGLLQVLHVGNPEVQYRNYVYTTSSSLGLPEHFREYAEEVNTAVGLPDNPLVVEIGSNDGTLLRAFKERGCRVVGVDPARDIGARARAAGIETVSDFFTADVARRIEAEHGAADLVIANNMFANVDELDDLVIGVRDLITPGGVFVFETQYGADVITKNLLDTVYHEHLSYFTVKPLALYFARLNMEVIDVKPIWTKGGSIRTFVQCKDGPRPAAQVVRHMIAEETRLGLYDPRFYASYGERLSALRRKLGDLVDGQAKRGKPVAGYGVSVGTTTLLSQFGLTAKIDFLVDDDPTKASSLVGPDYEIPVRPPEALYEDDPGAVIVFAWRDAEPIMKKHRKYRDSGGKFVIPLPDMTIK